MGKASSQPHSVSNDCSWDRSNHLDSGLGLNVVRWSSFRIGRLKDSVAGTPSGKDHSRPLTTSRLGSRRRQSRKSRSVPSAASSTSLSIPSVLMSKATRGECWSVRRSVSNCASTLISTVSYMKLWEAVRGLTSVVSRPHGADGRSRRRTLQADETRLSRPATRPARARAPRAGAQWEARVMACSEESRPADEGVSTRRPAARGGRSDPHGWQTVEQRRPDVDERAVEGDAESSANDVQTTRSALWRAWTPGDERAHSGGRAAEGSAVGRSAAGRSVRWRPAAGKGARTAAAGASARRRSPGARRQGQQTHLRDLSDGVELDGVEVERRPVPLTGATCCARRPSIQPACLHQPAETHRPTPQQPPDARRPLDRRPAATETSSRTSCIQTLPVRGFR